MTRMMECRLLQRRHTMRMRRTKTWVLLALALTLSGCHRYLVATPNLLLDRNPSGVFECCAADCQRPEAPVLYATDRAVLAAGGPSPSYGHGRSMGLAFGVARVSLSSNATWTELVRDSTQAERAREHELHVASVHEHGRMHSTHEPALAHSQDIVRTKFEAIDEANRRELQNLLQGRLAQTAHKDVFIFIHGYNNTFDDAVFRAAEVWHFMGRIGVPVAYTWPAGLGGIRGYAYDRESGDFTVSHLRRFIKAVADCPGVDRVHLIAHSRGVDVTISALRELHIECRTLGKSTAETLKLENLVLAAPDIDEEVFMQRFIGENMLQAARRTTIYASQHDKAIGLSDIIFASRRRLGMLASKDFSPRLKHALAKVPNVQFIDCRVSGWMMSHNYVFTHPAALSDLILVLRDRRDPGALNGRPLLQPAEGIWELTDDYLSLRDTRR
jgi:esterase/lipase superfamily enzyme